MVTVSALKSPVLLELILFWYLQGAGLSSTLQLQPPCLQPRGILESVGLDSFPEETK